MMYVYWVQSGHTVYAVRFIHLLFGLRERPIHVGSLNNLVLLFPILPRLSYPVAQVVPHPCPQLKTEFTATCGTFFFSRYAFFLS